MAPTLKIIKLNLRKSDIVKVTNYKEIFNKLEPGSVIKITKHPRYDVERYPVFLLKVCPYKRSVRSLATIEGVNMFTGKPWTLHHITGEGTEFELVKDRKKEEIEKITF